MVCPWRGLRRLVWTVQSSRTFQQTKYYCIIHGNRIVNSFFAIISVVKLAYLLSKSDVNTQVRNRSPNLCIQHLIPDPEKRDESLFFTQRVPYARTERYKKSCIRNLSSRCWFWLLYWLAYSMWYMCFMYVLLLFYATFCIHIRHVLLHTINALKVMHTKRSGFISQKLKISSHVGEKKIQ